MKPRVNVYLIFTFFLLSVLCSCRSNTNHSAESSSILSKEYVKDTIIYNKDTLNIIYKNKIEGFSVSVNWVPREANCSSVYGEADITFKHAAEKSFTLKHKFFSSSICGFDSTNGSAILPKQRLFNINYPINSENEFIRSDVPFYFADVNFDGKKELILVSPCEDQRFRDSLSVFALNDNFGLVDSTKQITHQEPYNLFDSQTKFFKKSKTLIVSISGAVHIYEERTYKANKNGLNLIKVEGVEYDSVYCYKY